jgi:F420H(2)-dependent quinone reductase
MLDWNSKIIEEFRANNGRVATFARQPLLLLTHVGAKTGKRRTNPLAYFRDGDRYIVGNKRLDVTAEPASPAERERLWAMVTRRNPAFKEYEKKTRRTIPLVILTPSLPGVGRARNV